MNVEERVAHRLLKEVSQRFIEHGEVHFSAPLVEEIATEEGANDQELEHVVRTLIEQGLLETPNWHHFTAGPETALYFEMEVDRRQHWGANVLRRRLLLAAAEAYHAPEEPVLTSEDPGPFGDVRWGELWSAARMLTHLGLLNERRGMGSIGIKATAEGYNVARDERALAAALPTNATDDEYAHAAVAADALLELIRDTEQMLRQRGWISALDELKRGDDQLEKTDWVDAVREYYTALESGLKHRLDEVGEAYARGAALRDLAGQAARAGAIPRNYQELFSFADSIRSPRSHGAGGQVVEVEVGPAEAHLMGNLVRSLLLYIGHRPQ